jgi:hypothetical protein
MPHQPTHQLTHQLPSHSTLAADCYKTVARCLAEMQASSRQRCLEVVSRTDRGLCLAEVQASVSQRCLEVVSRRDRGLCLAEMQASVSKRVLAEMQASVSPLQASRCITETQVSRRDAGRQSTRLRMRRPVAPCCKGKERCSQQGVGWEGVSRSGGGEGRLRRELSV